MSRRAGIIRLALAATALVAPAAYADAQGTLSTQGLGFPPGQLSTGALSLGGSTGEADHFSPLNPAAIALLPGPILLFQAAPEFRSMRVGNQIIRTSVARFPLFLGSLPFGRRWAIGASASTLLDRTWLTSSRDTQVINGEVVASTFTQRSEGSISDLRIAAAFAATPWLRFGIAGHAFGGRDVLRDVTFFDDSLRFARDTAETTIGFSGSAVSVGVHGFWPRIAAVGLSYRRGGAMRAYDDTTTVGRASAPDHYGASLLYLGISGTNIAARVARDSWSRLDGLASNLNIHEGWDVGLGTDVSGPRFFGAPLALRAGFRWRTLPFSASETPVKERTLSGGFGLPMARGGVELSLGALRATRTGGGSGLSETGWTFSTGFAVRP